MVRIGWMSRFDIEIRRSRVRFLVLLAFFPLVCGRTLCRADEVARLGEGPISAVLETEQNGYVITVRSTDGRRPPISASRILTSSNPPKITLEFDEILVPNPLSKPLNLSKEPAATSFRVLGKTDRTQVELEFAGEDLPPFEILPETGEHSVQIRVSAFSKANAPTRLSSDKGDPGSVTLADIGDPESGAKPPDRSKAEESRKKVIGLLPLGATYAAGGPLRDDEEIYDAPNGFRVRRPKQGLAQERATREKGSSEGRLSREPVETSGASIVIANTHTQEVYSLGVPNSRRRTDTPKRYSLFDDPEYHRRMSEEVPGLTVRGNSIAPVVLPNSKTISRISAEADGSSTEVTPPPILERAMKSWGAEHRTDNGNKTVGEGAASSVASTTSHEKEATLDSQDAIPSDPSTSEDEAKNQPAVNQENDNAKEVLSADSQAEGELVHGFEDEDLPSEAEGSDSKLDTSKPSSLTERVLSLMQRWSDEIGVGITLLGGVILLLVLLRGQRYETGRTKPTRRYRSSRVPTDAMTPVALAQNHLSVYYQLLNVNESASDEELERGYVQVLEQCEEELQKFGEAFPERSRRVRQRIENVREAYKTIRQVRDGLI